MHVNCIIFLKKTFYFENKHDKRNKSTSSHRKSRIFCCDFKKSTVVFALLAKKGQIKIIIFYSHLISQWKKLNSQWDKSKPSVQCSRFNPDVTLQVVISLRWKSNDVFIFSFFFFCTAMFHITVHRTSLHSTDSSKSPSFIYEINRDVYFHQK